MFPQKSNDHGFALIAVLTAITILTALLADFTFDTKINKLKTYNIQDKTQARLNAEAGLKIALTRLRLYQEAFNFIQKNESLKKRIKVDMLSQVYELPFVYPIPVISNMNMLQKDAIKKFEESSVIQGGMQVTIQNMSQLINLNLLRIETVSPEEREKREAEAEKNREDEENADASIQAQLTKMLVDAIEKEKEDNEDFEAQYGDVEAEELVAAIKHFISDKDSYEDVYTPGLEAYYNNENLTPKYAPLASISELHLIKGWDQAIVDLVKNEITAHDLVSIDLNKITERMLRLLVPNIEEDQVKEFFEYRDDPEEPHFFNNLEEFQKYIVDTAAITSKTNFEKTISKFEKAGIQFNGLSSLFKITSAGSYGRSKYSINAVVSMPSRPVYQPPAKGTPNPSPSATPTPTPTDENAQTNGQNQKEEEKKTPPLQFLKPRIVELFIN